MHLIEINRHNGQAINVEHVDNYRTRVIVYKGKCYEVTIGPSNTGPNRNYGYEIHLNQIHAKKIKGNPIQQEPSELEKAILKALKNRSQEATVTLQIKTRNTPNSS